jgi:hypothetical protein
MRRSPWFNITGKDYLVTAFTTARAVAPPGTLLFINDFNSTFGAKRQCLFNLTSELLAQGVPIDGVGHQLHNNFEFPPVQTMVDTLNLFATLGVTQHVTEMDVSIYSGSANVSIPNYDEIPQERFLRQARHYRDYFRVFKEHKEKLTSVTLWGLADDVTWLNQVGRVNAPLLFDDQLQHKLAYTAVVSPEDLPKTPATVTLSSLLQTYDGTPRVVSFATTPAGLPVVVTYGGSPTPPTGAGTYDVVATIDSEDYEGSATGTLVVEKALATIVLGSLSATYDGSPHGATALTSPPGLGVVFTYDGSPTAPTNAGSYEVVAVITDANYMGTAVGTLTIAKATAAIAFGGLLQVYDGSPKPVTVTTQPPGLTVQVTYGGSATAPIMPGSYSVLATIVDANYEGSASATLVITTTALVRHAPVVNGRLNGSLHLLLGESTTLNSSASVSGDFLVPGTPTVRLNGSPTYGGTTDSVGSASPAGYSVTLNGGAALRHVVRRVDALPFPTVAPPPSPAGTRDVVLNNAGQTPGSFATLRNLTLNSNAGQRAIPPGTYGTFIANGTSGFILGVAGATTPSVYNLQGLILNSGARLQVVGPVTLTLANGVTLNASAGNAANPQWLTVAIASGGLTLNSGATLHGLVTAPLGTVTLNGTLNGRVRSDRLVINGAGSLNNVP